MFYDQFIKLCDERGLKPTPTVKKMGLSPGNMKRWESGAAVNSETLEKCAAFFGVPIDYFFEGEETYQSAEISDNANAVTNVYYIMKAHPDIICSILSGNSLDAANLYRIANYMGCKAAYLNSEIDDGKFTDEPDLKKASNYLNENEQILDVLGRAAANKSYRRMQVQISRIVVSNLEKLGKSLNDVLEIKLSEKKTRDLFDRSKEPTAIAPFNCSDIFRIANEFRVSVTYLFTGRN
ncbi:MAG: helix-turn-helix transcriptional regulator [Muribaculaceae bacterium]|nr:helix-turn-helix transcriptional regulator [Muribaculaceae bacterium]MCM1480250.1 helix-turn-helix transcriptional regulator [Muribaculaceae bacterium]